MLVFLRSTASSSRFLDGLLNAMYSFVQSIPFTKWTLNSAHSNRKEDLLFDTLYPSHPILRDDAFYTGLRAALAHNISAVPKTASLIPSTVQASSLLRCLGTSMMVRGV